MRFVRCCSRHSSLRSHGKRCTRYAVSRRALRVLMSKDGVCVCVLASPILLHRSSAFASATSRCTSSALLQGSWGATRRSGSWTGSFRRGPSCSFGPWPWRYDSDMQHVQGAMQPWHSLLLTARNNCRVVDRLVALISVALTTALTISQDSKVSAASAEASPSAQATPKSAAGGRSWWGWVTGTQDAQGNPVSAASQVCGFPPHATQYPRFRRYCLGDGANDARAPSLAALTTRPSLAALTTRPSLAASSTPHRHPPTTLPGPI